MYVAQIAADERKKGTIPCGNLSSNLEIQGQLTWHYLPTMHTCHQTNAHLLNVQGTETKMASKRKWDMGILLAVMFVLICFLHRLTT